MSTLDPINDVETAFYEHKHYRYRGCAPHWDPALPDRVLGDEALSLDAWSASSEDGGEPQKERLAREKAAMAVCAGCPVLQACRAYANSETPDGKLVQPDGIWGGELALDRHRALIARRSSQPAPLSGKYLAEARTPQKLSVLAALARETDEELVAYRAGMDVRTANWHRSALCTLLGLNKETATRAQLLAAAASHELLPKRCRIVSDGQYPIAAAPTTDGARQRRIAAGALVTASQAAAPTAAPGLGPVSAVSAVSASPGGVDTPYVPVRVRAPRRDRFAAVPGQLSLDGIAPAGATVSVLPIHSVPLEAAA